MTLKYLAIALLVIVTAPDLNNKPSVEETAETTVRHEVVLVQEIEQPQLVKQEAVTKPEPQQSFPNKGCEAYRAEVAKYDWNVNIALAIMKAESGCRTNAVGDNRVIGGIYAPSCGLLQIRTLSGRPNCDQLKNPATNIEWAHKLYRASGWKPWTVYKTGAYRAYL